MKITQALLDKLTGEAKANPRLRMNLDLRNSSEDGSQRMLNAIEPGSVVPIHRHRSTSETVVCLRGRIVEEYYDELERMCTDAIELRPGGPVVAVNIPAGQWHTVRSLESGTVIMEIKDGAYMPTESVDILQAVPDSTAETMPKPQGTNLVLSETDLTSRLRQFIEDEARSCSMDPKLITAEYVYRMWGGSVPLAEIEHAMQGINK